MTTQVSQYLTVSTLDFTGAKDDGSLLLFAVQSSSQIITINKPTPSYLQAGCPSCRPTNSVKAGKAV